MVAAVCAFFAILQVGSMVLHRRRRLAIVKARSVAPVSEKDDFATKPASSGGALAAPLALKATIWKTMIWREFTVGMWSSSSSEMFWSVGYTLAMLVFGFIYSEFLLALFSLSVDKLELTLPALFFPALFSPALLLFSRLLSSSLKFRWEMMPLRRAKLPCMCSVSLGLASS